ncbi:MAG TPA: carboxypeptidase-like regulatory domain-containing protein [Terriglobales bacterium]
MKKLVAILALPLMLCTALLADKKPSAEIDFVVLRETNGKPVRNASVILHSVNKDGKQSKDAYEVKTDSDGKVSLSGLDFGKYRVQVLAEHLQTYGDDIEITEPQKNMTIKLKPPQSQYSIYK